MRVIFWGTPDFAVPCLEKIISSRHEVVAVVTVPDKEQGRGLKVSFSPVKQCALAHNIPVLQPEQFKAPEFIAELQSFSPDIFVVVAFKILPREVFSLPPYGSFNLHGSLLPKYRGAAPIQWALIKGDSVTGVTTFKIEDKVDTGNVYLWKELPISADDNFGSLHDKMSEIGSQATVETLDLIASGNFTLLQQDHSMACPAPKITKELCQISWDQPAVAIHNLIRGVTPFPGAFFMHKGNLIKLQKTKITDSLNLKPGEFIQTKTELFAGCGEGTLQILELQREGKRKMPVEEFLRGYSFS